MPVLIHLAPEALQKRILRHGIRAGRALGSKERGVFAMPSSLGFFVSHQWLRELKRNGVRTLVAIDFRLSSDELVSVGHYGKQHLTVPLGEAIKVIREQEDPLGFEIIVPRSIRPDEIVRARAVPQNVGWRVEPKAKGTRPCTCPFCMRGQIKAARIRRRLGE
jgi:hypothetical protein